ncbi:MAG: UDP-N-acetylmuramoyl-L-alanyl-D-glutamate--2,6-diaminopimelate ligase [Deltaproteobacteria bacterium]|nr:UDP-N-acetylmuramoyl-L-alanyl-D-glutamate--2,6-diaminopimelate ligase [Deltaproteobacteria bacterium]
MSDAVFRGAVAVVAQRQLDADVPLVRVSNTRRALGLMAAAFYGNPSQNLIVSGICGTNGKTTTAFLLENMLLVAGFSTGLIGTVAYRYAGRKQDAPLTTPEPDGLQSMLAEMRDAGVSHVVMEVSSHGIAQERIAGCVFSVGVFTNLSQDHLDFHKDMETYWAVKKSFFTNYLKASSDSCAVINTDDHRGNELAREIARMLKDVRVITVGTNPRAMVSSKNVEFSEEKTKGEISFEGNGFMFDSNLVGRFNLENILCACGAALALGLGPEEMRAGIESFDGVPGRLEVIPDRNGRHVFVDFAHTPAALENLLENISELVSGRMICVFGCGGDRDRAKRPLMGKIACEKADLCIVTSDNPRTENPERIIGEIVSGINGLGFKNYAPEDLESGFRQKGYAIVSDRRAAIRLAVMASSPGDSIVIAGKGHEICQIVGKKKFPFDDRAEAKKSLEQEGK